MDLTNLTDTTDLPGSHVDRSPLTCVRVFELVRHKSASEGSVDVVADGVEFPMGSVAFRWRTEWPFTIVLDSIEHLRHVYCNDGKTEIRWAGYVPVTPFRPWQLPSEPHQPWPTPEASRP